MLKQCESKHVLELPYLMSISSGNGRYSKIIEKYFSVDTEIMNANSLQVVGDSIHVMNAANVFLALNLFLSKDNHVDEQIVSYLCYLSDNHRLDDFCSTIDQTILVTPKGKSIRAKTLGQKMYVDALRENEMVFCIGPAGTGKTYLAVAMAVAAFRKKEVSKIILARPAVEAGERLGFLPGDIQEKVDPYMRPIYDALQDLLGEDVFLRCIEKGQIEVSPLAFMRGRTLDDSFILLDEAQNTTVEQMKMFLTRIGMNAKACICGDITQIDLPCGTRCGLSDAAQILCDIEGIRVITLSDSDIVRNPLVQRIIRAYNRQIREGGS